LERWEKPENTLDKRQCPNRVPSHKLTAEERQRIITTVNSAPYQNLPPCKIVPLLADQGIYLGSESTVYRLLRSENQLKHRQLSRPATHHKPKAYEATGANQVWSWDISYLPTQVKGLYFYLYLFMDIYSRKIVGWSVHEVESSTHASHLVNQICLDEKVQQNQVVLHSDNGASMKGVTMRAMLEKLGVVASFSRPSVSDDNPYSEALFKTLKYHPTFPQKEKFATLFEARKWSEAFTTWYNQEHLHSGIKFVTPEQRHQGLDKLILQKRHAVYEEAKKQQPQRWSGSTRDWSFINKITLNPNKKLNTIHSSLKSVA
jgi:transposase InsO family protein